MPKLQLLLQEPIGKRHLTVEQFLCNLDTNSILEGVSEQGLTEALSNLHQHVAPPVQQGLELLNRLQTKANIVPTGCISVDTLLAGGLREGHLTEFYGEPASGKTQLCTTAAVASAMRGDRVLYIDTTGSFSSRRAAAIYNTLNSRLQDKRSLTDVLQSIHVNRVHTVHDALAALDAQALSMQGLASQNAVCQPKLLIVDSVSALITPILGAGGTQQSHGHALMSALGRMLKYMATCYTVAILCTNHMVGSGTNPRPALGESWKNQPHTRLQLIRPDVGEDRLAVLSASASNACNQQATFQLT